ncbi:hypothetical protein [Polaribacter staleyi]|uniref:hypothetical protein n=1 Tax=Polaribacter staleyi TaxID=2022337 RepID=UPI0031B9B828
MKNYLLFLAFLFFLTANSQSKNNQEKDTLKQNKERLFQKQVTEIINAYQKDSIIVQSELLNTRLSKAFNQVIFSSSDLVDNASAFGVSQNEEKTTVSVSTNFLLPDKSINQLFLKAGINSSGSGSVFNIYSRNEWQNSVGANIGFIYKFSGTGISNENDVKLKYDKVLREIFIRDSIMKEVVALNFEEYIKIRKEYISSINNSEDLIKPRYDEGKDTIYRNELKENYKKLARVELLLKKIEKQIPDYKNSKENNKHEILNFSNYDTSTNNKNDKIIQYLLTELWKEESKGKFALRDLVNDVAYVYDEKNIKNTGYSFWWLDGNFKLNNDTFNFSEKAENVESEVLSEFNNLDAGERTGLNKLSKEVSLNINYSRNSLYGALYLKGGVKFNSGSFLNSNLINGTANIYELNGDQEFLIQDKDNVLLGKLNSIDEDLSYGSLNIYGAYFFGKKKVFGLNLALTHRYRIETPESSFYKNNYSVLFGPVFRKPKKDDDTGLTFGIDIGFDNAIYAYNANDNFVARIRVGIPFNLYTMKK